LSIVICCTFLEPTYIIHQIWPNGQFGYIGYVSLHRLVLVGLGRLGNCYHNGFWTWPLMNKNIWSRSTVQVPFATRFYDHYFRRFSPLIFMTWSNSGILRQKRQFQRQIIGRKKFRKIITLVPDQDVRLFAPKLTIRRLSQWIDSKNTDVRTRVTRWLKWKIAKKISPTYFFVKIYALLFLWNSSSKVGPTYIIFKQNCRK
jgi:hypothetical protein